MSSIFNSNNNVSSDYNWSAMNNLGPLYSDHNIDNIFNNPEDPLASMGLINTRPTTTEELLPQNLISQPRQSVFDAVIEGENYERGIRLESQTLFNNQMSGVLDKSTAVNSLKSEPTNNATLDVTIRPNPNPNTFGQNNFTFNVDNLSRSVGPLTARAQAQNPATNVTLGNIYTNNPNLYSLGSYKKNNNFTTGNTAYMNNIEQQLIKSMDLGIFSNNQLGGYPYGSVVDLEFGYGYGLSSKYAILIYLIQNQTLLNFGILDNLNTKTKEEEKEEDLKQIKSNTNPTTEISTESTVEEEVIKKERKASNVAYLAKSLKDNNINAETIAIVVAAYNRMTPDRKEQFLNELTTTVFCAEINQRKTKLMVLTRQYAQHSMVRNMEKGHGAVTDASAVVTSSSN